MLTLGIETSGRNASIALLDERAVLEQFRFSEQGDSTTKSLPVCVQRMLRKQGIKPYELDCLAVSRGPGSFTGLRVGLVFAKTFSYATGVPLAAVDTFAVIVEQLNLAQGRLQTETVEVVEDLRKGQIAWQRFSQRGNNWKAEDEINVTGLEDWALLSRENVSLTGPTVDRILKQLPEKNALFSATILPEKERFPSAVEVAILGQTELERNGPLHPFELKPLYIRRSAAEEKKRA